jgi:hypothetical protein
MRLTGWGLLALVVLGTSLIASPATGADKKTEDFFAPLTVGMPVGLVATDSGYHIVAGKVEKGKVYNVNVGEVRNSGATERFVSVEIVYTVAEVGHNFVVLDGPGPDETTVEMRVPIHSVKALIVIKSTKKAP